MSLDTLKATFPDYAKDVKLNLGALTQITSLTEQQLWGTILASALATRSAVVIQGLQDEAAEHLGAEATQSARSAAAVMAMNNIYYRALHLLDKEEYSTLPARLRMTVIGNPKVDKIDFELWCLAVSAVNGCGRCLESHEAVLKEKGTNKEMIQDALRVAAIVHAAGVTLETDQITSAQAHL